ncbi:uncharacterized protein LY89DRAFT_748545 [Mollisia scopiformis]|uniref:Uncharacterized protein n=1 Tax=Mollisia scopiformis TaxID=149040 RepID=A0A194XAM2_MOLSC|nr:uncharacterized protein LY89DRAFT_748545 [Mollisia scopiformis]KUJ17220.1 hypothetical protein LY89DRAFT_748545 [Mollisia scopiformis]
MEFTPEYQSGFIAAFLASQPAPPANDHETPEQARTRIHDLFEDIRSRYLDSIYDRFYSKQTDPADRNLEVLGNARARFEEEIETTRFRYQTEAVNQTNNTQRQELEPEIHSLEIQATNPKNESGDDLAQQIRQAEILQSRKEALDREQVEMEAGFGIRKDEKSARECDERIRSLVRKEREKRQREQERLRRNRVELEKKRIDRLIMERERALEREKRLQKTMKDLERREKKIAGSIALAKLEAKRKKAILDKETKRVREERRRLPTGRQPRKYYH